MSGVLQGKRILVTRAATQAGKLSLALRAEGAEPVEVPLLEIVPPKSFAPLDNALQNLSRYDWLILSSANAVEAIVDRATRSGVSLVSLCASVKAEEQFSTPMLKVAAVGRATAEAARKVGLAVTVVPEHFVAESLLAALATFPLLGKRILIARAAIARDFLPDSLRQVGAIVDVVDAYRNQMPDASIGLLRQALEQGIDAVTFTSSSSVTHLAEAARASGVVWPLPEAVAVSIGPVTSNTLRDLGWEPVAEADPHEIPGLVVALVRYFSQSTH